MYKKLLPFLSSLFLGFAVNAQNVYKYAVDLSKPTRDELKIELIVPKITRSEIIFYMPKIVPGTYTNSDFGKFVHNVKALIKPENHCQLKQCQIQTAGK